MKSKWELLLSLLEYSIVEKGDSVVTKSYLANMMKMVDRKYERMQQEEDRRAIIYENMDCD